MMLLGGKSNSDAPAITFLFNKIVGHNDRDKHDKIVHDPIVRPRHRVPCLSDDSSRQESMKVFFSSSTDPEHREWVGARSDEYRRLSEHSLSHSYRTSPAEGQLYDVSVFLVRHVRGTARPQQDAFEEIERVEFFPGSAWGECVFVSENTGGPIGFSLSTYGSFLVTARIHFRGASRLPEITHRYIDFSNSEGSPAPSSLKFFKSWFNDDE